MHSHPHNSNSFGKYRVILCFDWILKIVWKTQYVQCSDCLTSYLHRVWHLPHSACAERVVDELSLRREALATELARLHGAVGAHTLSAAAHAEQCDAQVRSTVQMSPRMRPITCSSNNHSEYFQDH